MVKVICVNGVSRSGKDTFIKFIREQSETTVVVHSTIDTIRKMLIESGLMVGDRKGIGEREFMVAVKQAWIKYSDGPYNQVIDKVLRIKKFMEPADIILFFVQVREPQEIKKLKLYYGDDFITVVVKKKGIEAQIYNDMCVTDMEYDFVIENNGTVEDLKVRATHFLNSIG